MSGAKALTYQTRLGPALKQAPIGNAVFFYAKV
jgi:hypothetical protein